jgi:hypothetical protein
LEKHSGWIGTIAWTSTLAYNGIRALQIHNVL